MNLKLVTWNIGGAQFRLPDADVCDDYSYIDVDIDRIVDVLAREDADIICLQETHRYADTSDTEVIAHALGSHFFHSASYVKQSHLNHHAELALGIISKFELLDPVFTLFTNPNLPIVFKDRTEMSDDKGVLRCSVLLPNGKKIEVQTTHLFPFRRLQVDPTDSSMSYIMSDIVAKLMSSQDISIIAGDFNLDSPTVEPCLPKLSIGDMREMRLPEPTTPKGRYYDHILYRGCEQSDIAILSNVLTDHYPVVGTFHV